MVPANRRVTWWTRGADLITAVGRAATRASVRPGENAETATGFATRATRENMVNGGKRRRGREKVVYGVGCGATAARPEIEL